jgi:hypothetical protein
MSFLIPRGEEKQGWQEISFRMFSRDDTFKIFSIMMPLQKKKIDKYLTIFMCDTVKNFISAIWNLQKNMISHNDFLKIFFAVNILYKRDFQSH